MATLEMMEEHADCYQLKYKITVREQNGTSMGEFGGVFLAHQIHVFYVHASLYFFWIPLPDELVVRIKLLPWVQGSFTGILEKVLTVQFVL